MKHNLLGNCWDSAAVYPDGEMNDICDIHDYPRGSCIECPECVVCTMEEP